MYIVIESRKTVFKVSIGAKLGLLKVVMSPGPLLFCNHFSQIANIANSLIIQKLEGITITKPFVTFVGIPE